VWAPQGRQQGCGRLHRHTPEPVPRLDAWPSQRWRCTALVEKNGTGKASGSVYAEKKTFFGATEEGGAKALVYELGTGKPKGERIEETLPWMSVPTYKEAMVRQRHFMRAHEYTSSSTNTQKSERCVVK